jgi:uncharacterized RDD family membrane protein YckC
MFGGRPMLQEGYVFASVGRRFAAWVVDLILLLIASGAIAALLGGWQGHTRTFVGTDGSTFTSTTYVMDTLWSEMLLALLSGAYVIPLWTIWGATLGQRMLGIQVLDAGSPRPLQLWQAVVRWAVLFSWTALGIGSYYSGVFTLAALIWVPVLLIAVMRSSRKQGLQDRAARSLVVSRVRYWAMPGPG